MSHQTARVIPLSLEGLTPRQAIKDTAYRLARSFDYNDIEAFNSVMTEDAVLEMNIAEPLVFSGSANIRAATFDRISKLDSSHMLSNMRIHIEEDEKEAVMQCYSLSQHCPLGRGKDVKAPKYIAGAEYEFEMVLGDDGLWRVKKWVAGLIWADGDESVLQESGGDIVQS